MLNLGLIAFANPWVLTALLALPAIWYLLRVIPPAPKRLRFPALSFLLGLQAKEETTATTPLWLLLLRLCIAALIILALARPIINPSEEAVRQGSVVLIVDDGWAAAPNWQARRETMTRYVNEAQRANQELILLGTAPETMFSTPQRLTPPEALDAIASWRAVAYPVDRTAAREALATLDLAEPTLVYLSDGMLASSDERPALQDLLATVAVSPGGTVIAEPNARRATVLYPAEASRGLDLSLAIRRPHGQTAQTVELRALGADGAVLAARSAVFEERAREAQAVFDLDVTMRNQIERFQLASARGVSETVLFDASLRRQIVGLLGPTGSASQPLLAELYYVEKALLPYAELRRGPLTELLNSVSVLVISDGAVLADADRAAIDTWVREGGFLVRFAGPSLAARNDSLVPVDLRRGDRQLGGALSWDEPLPLQDFAEDSPFFGLTVPSDARVSQQVLAQPSPDLARKTWARLTDDTPIITAEARGEGRMVLFHVTANANWSDLPLSGLFVTMLRRLIDLAPGVGVSAQGRLLPVATFTGDGRLQDPPPGLDAVEAGSFDTLVAGPAYPPGLYGRISGDRSSAERALHLTSALPDPQPISADSWPVRPQPYRGVTERPLLPWLLAAALLLALLDWLIGMVLRGLLPAPGPRRTAATAASVAFALMLLPLGAWAQSGAVDDTALPPSLQTRLAYVETGVSDLDAHSEAGLSGLAQVIEQRTAIEAGEPMPVNLAEDDLALYPLLYWPVAPETPRLGDAAKRNLATYLRDGGLVLIDTRDAGALLPGATGVGPGGARLREVLAGLDLPPLEPIPDDHVLTRSFYLLQDFPGRYDGQTVWVEPAIEGRNDGVASVIIGAHDWAGAWALDEYSRPVYPVLPGGERQREIARRFGINLAMYALTGNYKTDQVHIPALLERLGQ